MANGESCLIYRQADWPLKRGNVNGSPSAANLHVAQEKPSKLLPDDASLQAAGQPNSGNWDTVVNDVRVAQQEPLSTRADTISREDADSGWAALPGSGAPETADSSAGSTDGASRSGPTSETIRFVCATRCSDAHPEVRDADSCEATRRSDHGLSVGHFQSSGL
jgi:hypothetical protein